MNIPRMTRTRRSLLVASVALAGLGAVAVPVFTPYSVQAEATQPSTSLLGPDGSYAPIVKMDKPAIVTVMVTMKPGVGPNGQMNGQVPPGMQEFFRHFFGQNGPMPNMPGQDGNPPQQAMRALGSGFIISPDGTIVTNNHVVKDAAKITVKLDDGREFKGKVVGTDPRTDIAVIKIDAKNLPTVTWGDSNHVQVGDKVIAIGNPFGVGTTVTAGIVSARARDLHNGPYDDFLQVDAAINHGNSGGALIATNGKVVGITSAIFSPNNGSVGVGFAIPSDQAQKIVADLVAHGSIKRGYLGVMIQQVNPDIAKAMGLQGHGGALVAEVNPNTPAAKAGLKVGDVVVAVDGKDIASPRALSLKIADTKPGSTADLTVMRNGKKIDVPVVTATLPSENQMASAAPSQQNGNPSAVPQLGLNLQPVQPDQRQQLGLADNQNGLVVTSVNPTSGAADRGIQPGDVILSVDTRPVTTTAEVESVIKDSSKAGKNMALLLIDRQGNQQFVAVPIAAS